MMSADSDTTGERKRPTNEPSEAIARDANAVALAPRMARAIVAHDDPPTSRTSPRPMMTRSFS